MSLANRNNPYTFDDFLKWRSNVDYYTNDTFFQRVLHCYTEDDFIAIDKAARDISRKASFRWRDLSESIARLEKRPYMLHYDGHNNRIDKIVRPAETEIMEKEIFSEKLFNDKISPWIRPVKMYIMYQNGESCIGCPVTCTEGLVALLEKYADTPETKNILKHCKEGIEGNFAIGAQYLSEIQGGSDVPANLLEAVPDGNHWRLYGTKFFCSATHADYAVVTGKPQGSENIGLFVIPSWLPGNKEKEIRNGYTIDKIKWKLGTSELTTGELTFNGALAYQVGPLERGLANVVGTVLTYSRITVGLSSAAYMARAAREAKQYSSLRKAFGITIGEFPMVSNQVEDICAGSENTVAGAFKLYRDFLYINDKKNASQDISFKQLQYKVRELIMLQKITSAYDSTDIIRSSMSIFGGNGVIEDFSSLPRLYRDSAVNELWEGPRNVLLAQIHRDLQKATDWYHPSELIKNILSGMDANTIKDLTEEAEELVAYPNLFENNEKTKIVCKQWEKFCTRLTHTFQQLAREEVLDHNF